MSPELPGPPASRFENYNLSCRNLLIVAYLDGRTPCVVALRGTYGVQLAEAWQLKDGKLERLWSYDNEAFPGCWGQGAHTNYALDVDGDGRDEIVLGSVVLDDNGVPLWTTGKGASGRRVRRRFAALAAGPGSGVRDGNTAEDRRLVHG
ncbi:MAG: hypothetical protein ACOX6W_10930 [Lentisphaeria bacterium]